MAVDVCPKAGLAEVRRIRTELFPQFQALTDLPGAYERLLDPGAPLTNGLSRGAEVPLRAQHGQEFC